MDRGSLKIGKHFWFHKVLLMIFGALGESFWVYEIAFLTIFAFLCFPS